MPSLIKGLTTGMATMITSGSITATDFGEIMASTTTALVASATKSGRQTDISSGVKITDVVGIVAAGAANADVIQLGTSAPALAQTAVSNVVGAAIGSLTGNATLTAPTDCQNAVTAVVSDVTAKISTSTIITSTALPSYVSTIGGSAASAVSAATTVFTSTTVQTVITSIVSATVAAVNTNNPTLLSQSVVNALIAGVTQSVPTSEQPTASSLTTAITTAVPSASSLTSTIARIVSEIAPTVTAVANPTTLTQAGTVTLTATAASGTGSYTYTWVQLSGPVVSITNGTSATANVTINAQGTYVFGVTVQNASPGTKSTSTTVTVTPSLTQTVSLAAQSGTITSGIVGSSTFAVTTTNISNNTAGTFTWFTDSAGTSAGSAPTGITATVSAIANNSATVTMTASALAAAGSYYFTVTEGSARSSVAILTVITPSRVNIAAQSGTITSGIAGSATFSVTTNLLASGANGNITWYTTLAGTTVRPAPTGITATVSAIGALNSQYNGSATVTMTATASTIVGSYYFTINYSSWTSAVATLQIVALTNTGNINGIVTTLAGGTIGSDNGPGYSAKFRLPEGLATDGTNIYVADSSNNMIRQIVISTDMVTTLAGSTTPGASNGIGTSASFNNPTAVATDGTNVDVADGYNNLIRKIVIATGVVSTLAGGGTYTTGTNGDGIGTAAVFNLGSTGITTDGNNVYTSDSYGVRQIVIGTGVVTTLATSSKIYSATGILIDNTYGTGIATDGKTIYVSNYLGSIYTVTISTGTVASLAGKPESSGYTTGGANGVGSVATFDYPSGLATDGTNLYVCDANDNLIRKIVIASTMVTTLAGNISGGFADGTGSTAAFSNPNGIAFSKNNPGVLFVCDTNNNAIREIQ